MTLINEWILKNDLKDNIGDKDLIVYGKGTLKQSGKETLLDGTYGLSTNGAYPLPDDYTLSIIIDIAEIAKPSEYYMIFGNGTGQSYVGKFAQGITSYDGMFVDMTGTGDAYSDMFLKKVEANTRYHLIMSMSASGFKKIYINGVKVLGKQVSTDKKYNPLTIGGYANSVANSGNWSFMKGKVNNARLYNHTLSDDEALELYKSYIIKNKTLILHEGEYKKWSEKREIIIENETEIERPNILTLKSSSNSEFVVTASNSYNIDRDGWRVFDGTGSNLWHTTTATASLIIQRKSGKWKIESFSMTSTGVFSSEAINVGRMPSSWSIDGSDDGLSWYTIQSYNYTDWKRVVEEKFTVNNPKEYNYFRFNITDIKTPSQGQISIGAMKLNASVVITTYETIYKDSALETVSSTLPTSTQFLLDGMDSLSPLLDRKVTTVERLLMTNKTSILLGDDEEGKLFSKVVKLKDHMDIRSIETEAK